MSRSCFHISIFVVAFGLLSSVFLGLAPAGRAAAQDQERVAVRVGEHPGFSRIVFDWGRPVAARLEQVDGKTLLRFDRAATLDLKAFRADPPPEISHIEVAVADGGLLVTLTTVPGAKTRLFDSAGKTVLDVLGPRTAVGVKAATPEEWRRKVETSTGKKPQENPILAVQTAATPKAASPKVSETPAGIPGSVVSSQDHQAATSAPISLLPPAPVPAPTGEAGPSAAKSDPAKPVVAAKIPPPPLPKPAVPATTAAVPAATATAVPTIDPAAVANADAETPPAYEEIESLVPSGTIPVLIDTSPLPGKKLTLGQRRALRFEWPVGAVPAAAAFRRDGNLWLVFDRPPQSDLAGQTAKAAPELEPVAQFEVDGATVLRIAVPGLMTPWLLREDDTWILKLDRGVPSSEGAIQMLVEGGPGQGHASFPVESPGRVISFVDPARGDRLIVATLSTAGHRTLRDREFPQFRTLASYQGLVVQPLSETLRVTTTTDAIELRDDEGLIVSRGGSLALLKSNQRAPRRGPRLFDLETWRRGDAEDFAFNKHKLLSAIAAADPDRVMAARLKLAEFFFAHGLSTEALSMVRLSQGRGQKGALDPRAHLIAAAAEFLTEDYSAAAEGLFHPALAGEWEADLWRAALAAASQDWELAATGFAAAKELIDAYPQTVRARLRLLAAEASLAIGEKVAAEGYLEAVRLDNPNNSQQAQVAFLFARGLYLEGDIETASELWRRVASSKHASSRIRARLALLDLALEDGSMSADDAIEMLERLRFAWRGDRFEFALLQRLGDLYIQKGSHRQGLRLLRRAAANTPDPELSMAVAARMSAVFTGLFYKSSAELPPLQALTLFEEFKELTPPGEEGDAVILNLAERLVQVDLLDRAAGVLETQVEFRLKGQARARVAARLARIHLLGQKPVQALAALDVSKMPDLPAELALERQRLRAQALLDLEREQEALVALGAADDPESLRLRARILWREKNWTATVMVLERLVPRAPPELRPLREEESKAVVDLLVALTMADETNRIRSLGKAYQEAMSRGPHAQTFRLLAGDPEANQSKTVEEELAGVADIEAFMASYRKNTRPAAKGAAQ